MDWRHLLAAIWIRAICPSMRLRIWNNPIQSRFIRFTVPFFQLRAEIWNIFERLTCGPMNWALIFNSLIDFLKNYPFPTHVQIYFSLRLIATNKIRIFSSKKLILAWSFDTWNWLLDDLWGNDNYWLELILVEYWKWTNYWKWKKIMVYLGFQSMNLKNPNTLPPPSFFSFSSVSLCLS